LGAKDKHLTISNYLRKIKRRQNSIELFHLKIFQLRFSESPLNGAALYLQDGGFWGLDHPDIVDHMCRQGWVEFGKGGGDCLLKQALALGRI
jgi:hypothetical protein